MRKRYGHIVRILLVALPVLAAYPMVRIGTDWARLSGVPREGEILAPPRGFDWVEWEDVDGSVTAQYVFPAGTAYRAGIRQGDVLYELEYRQFYSAADLKRAVEGIPPGEVRTYSVQRDSGLVYLDVRISRYPTFAYPLSTPLWYASIWGFTLAAFLHLLALIVVLPLAVRTRFARLPGLLILASTLWVFGNLARLLWVELIGPPELLGTFFTSAFEGLTLVGLTGWIAFPTLLLAKVVSDTGERESALRRLWPVTWLPAAVLFLLAVVATFADPLGPFTLAALIGPVLFYVSCYIAAATGLSIMTNWARPGAENPRRWLYWGNAVVLAVSLFAALVVLDLIPLPGTITDTTAGWLVVSIQLISAVPVGLISFDTLRYGKLDRVLTRSVAYLSSLGLVFFAYIGVMYALQPYFERFNVPAIVLSGFVVVSLLVVFERLARWLQPYLEAFLTTDRQRARKDLARLAGEMRTMMDVSELAQVAIATVCRALDARSGTLFVSPTKGAPTWIQVSHHPEPPFLTEPLFRGIWPELSQSPTVWARNPELNEVRVSRPTERSLVEFGAFLAIPVSGEDAALGLLILGPKRRRRAVYNLEDLDLLRSVCGQLALALERVYLVEREKELIRISAEAQLAALRAQINPHFLFNTLNTIASLIEESPVQAEQTIEHLAAIFRHILQTGSRPFVTLGDELTLVRHYLSIEQARFGPRLRVVTDIGSDLENLRIPAFSIQTLVENAVQHGVGKKRHGGRVTIRASRASDDPPAAEIIVADSGVGIASLFNQQDSSAAEFSFFGMGLSNVSTRLEKLYDRSDLLTISSNPENGTVVRLLIPVEVNGESEAETVRPHSS